MHVDLRNCLINSAYPTHFKHRIQHESYAWIGDEISRQNSAIFVSVILYFTWCGMVRCIHLVTPTFIAEITEVIKLASSLYSYFSSRRMHTSLANSLFKYIYILRFRMIFNETIGLNIDFAQLPEP